jgi:translocation and assembly module TamA
MLMKIPYSIALVSAISAFAPATADIGITWEGQAPAAEIQQLIDPALVTSQKPASPLQARRQARLAGEKVTQYLNSEGYLDPTIQTGVSVDGEFEPLLRVDVGRRFVIASVSIQFSNPDTTPVNADALQAAADNLRSQFVIAPNVIAVEQDLISALRAAGYPYATAAKRNIVGDRDAASVDIRYRINLGPRVKYGTVRYPDGIRTKPSYLKRLVPFEAGEVFDPESLARLNTRLSDTRIFQQSSAQLSDAGTPTGEPNTEIRDIELRLAERPRNTLALGGSLSTSEGPGISAELTRRNLIGRGDLLEVELTVATLDRSLDVTWRRPNEFGYGRGLVLRAGLSDETTDAFDSQSIEVGAGYEVVEGPDFSWSYGATVEAIRETSERAERDLQLVSFYAGARVDRSNNLLNPTKGWRAEARISPHQSFGDSGVQYLLMTGQARYYYPLNDKFTLANRLRIGVAAGADLRDLPSDDRFYAGGGGSVRGYAYQAIGPRSGNDEPIGGRSLVDGSFEVRWQRSRSLGFVGFLDAGSVGLSEQPRVDNLRTGAGFGARYSTPAGPIRFDIAVPIDKTEFDDPVQFYISIGQAF